MSVVVTTSGSAPSPEVRIRPVRAEDRDALQRLHTGISDTSRYLRFFGFSRTAPARFVKRLVEPATPTHQAMTAWVGDDLVGVANYEGIAPGAAELAVLVADGWHEHGIGTALVRQLARAALANGITTFEADVLGNNTLAHRMLADLGCPTSTAYDGAVGRFVLRLDGSAAGAPE